MLYPYQKKWILDDSRFKIGKFARQSGKTFSTTLEIVDRVMDAEADGDRSNWIILSRSERQSKELMDEGIKLHFRARGMVLESLEYEFLDDLRVNALEVITPGGSKITGVPANPDTARGFSRNVYLDEFAFHQDSVKIWGALFPIVSKQGLMLRITSTPNGTENMFYRIAENDQGKFARWSRHEVDIYEAVRQGLDRDIDELRDGLGDDDLWGQEYELRYLDEAYNWLSYDLIKTCEDANAGDPDNFYSTKAKPTVFLGLDLGLKKDLWVLTVGEMVGDVLWVRESIERYRPTIDERDSIVASAFSQYHVARMSIDQTGLGEDVTQRYQRYYGEHRVEGVVFSQPNKLVLANSIRNRFQKRHVRVPEDDTYRRDLHSVQKTITPTGGMRLDAASGPDGHADRFWSLALCSYSADNSDGPVEIIVKAEPDWVKQAQRQAQASTGLRGSGRLVAARRKY